MELQRLLGGIHGSDALTTGILVGLFALVGSFLSARLQRGLDNRAAERLRQRQLSGAIRTVLVELESNKHVIQRTLGKNWSLARLPVKVRAYEQVELLLAEVLPADILAGLGVTYSLLRILEHAQPPPEDAELKVIAKRMEETYDALLDFRNQRGKPSPTARLRMLLAKAQGSDPRSDA